MLGDEEKKQESYCPNLKATLLAEMRIKDPNVKV